MKNGNPAGAASCPVSKKRIHAHEESLEDDTLVLINSEEIPSHELASLLNDNSRWACKPQPIIQLRSKGALLILGLTCLVDISYNGALGTILSALLTNVFHYEQAGVKAFLGITIVRSLPQLAYPIAGWLADVHYGRYKVIVSGLWLMLVGYVIIFIAFLIKYLYDTHWGMYIAYLGVFPVAFLTINSGLAAFNANIIPFGLDQMPGASTEQLSAFVHWYYAARNILAGVIPLIPCIITHHSDLTFVVHSVAEFVCVLLAIILAYGLKRWLIIEPRSENPFKTVYNVLKFASKHKVPVLRSSFTYWEDELPKRIDLAKSKYGGPFTTEKVEDVKTVIRITVVLLTLCGYVIGYHITLKMLRMLEKKLLHFSLSNFNCNFGHLLDIEVDTIVVAVCVAVFELVIRPLFGNFIPSMRKRMGFGMAVGLIATVSLMVLDIKGYKDILPLPHNMSSVVEEDSLCYLVNGTEVELLDVESYFLTIFYVLVALSEALVYIAVLEFIIAQSPYGMSGLLIGSFYCLRGLFAFIGATLLLSFSLGYEHHPQSTNTLVSCGVPLHVVIIVIEVVGLVCYIIVARNYTNREREEHVNTHVIAENYYGSIIKSRSLRRNNIRDKK